MNLPNKITLARVCIIPIFLVIYILRPFEADYLNVWLALCLFSVAAITDALDGYLARKMNLVTNFGKLMDPLADKLLVCAALVAFAASGTLPAWAVIIMISREFYVSGLRQIAVEQNIVLAASNGAKFKTIAQMVLVIYLLSPITIDIVPFDWVILIVAVLASVLSAFDYTVKNLSVFRG